MACAKVLGYLAECREPWRVTGRLGTRAIAAIPTNSRGFAHRRDHFDSAAFESANQYLRDGRPVYTLQKDTTCPDCELVPAEPTQYEQSLMRVLLPGTLESLPGQERLPDIEAAPGLTLHSYTLSPWPLQPDQPARLRLCWTGQTSLLSAKIGKLEIDLQNGWLGQEFRFEGKPDATGCTIHDFVAPPAPFVDEAEARLSVFLTDAEQPEVSLSLGTVPIAPWMEEATPERLMTRVPSAGMLVGQGAELLGLTNDSVTSPGISFPVTAYWKHLTPGIGPQPEIVLELQEPSGAIVDRRRVAMAPALPAERWPAPGITAARYGLTVPRLGKPGTYTILADTPDDPKRTRLEQSRCRTCRVSIERRPSPIEPRSVSPIIVSAWRDMILLAIPRQSG